MSLRTTLGGTSILSLVSGTQTPTNELYTRDEVVFPSGGIASTITGDELQEPIIPKRVLYGVGSISADEPRDRNGLPINSKTGQIVYYRKQLAELEKQERYEECAKVRDRLNELIYSDIR